MMRHLDGEKKCELIQNTFGGESEIFGLKRLNLLTIIIYSLNFEDKFKIDEIILSENFANTLNVNDFLYLS